jgi:small subunit ribosomal protein S17
MPRRVMQGTVTSSASDKTITVLVERRIMHPMYKKYITRSKKFLAHDEQNKFKAGDVVRIRECRPLSKRKHWEVLYEDAVGTRS